MTLPNCEEPGTYVLKVLSDDVHTVASVLVKHPMGGYSTVGEGVARRRPGDKRDSQLGVLLAFRRAMEDAITTLDQRIAERDYQTFLTKGERSRMRYNRKRLAREAAEAAEQKKPDETVND